MRVAQFRPLGLKTHHIMKEHIGRKIIRWTAALVLTIHCIFFGSILISILKDATIHRVFSNNDLTITLMVLFATLASGAFAWIFWRRSFKVISLYYTLFIAVFGIFGIRDILRIVWGQTDSLVIIAIEVTIMLCTGGILLSLKYSKYMQQKRTGEP